MSLCSTLFLKPCFPNRISQTQRREIENGPSCSLRQAVRNLTQPGALCFVCRVSPLWRHHRAAPPSVIPASWHLRTALATVSSLFGKIVACSKTMIKVHDGNKKKKINKISVTRLQLPVSLWTQPREESAKEVKNETQRSKT